MSKVRVAWDVKVVRPEEVSGLTKNGWTVTGRPEGLKKIMMRRPGGYHALTS